MPIKLLASVVLLFMVIPVVPWGLKQCLTAIALIYVTFTFSTLGVAGRFRHPTTWGLAVRMVPKVHKIASRPAAPADGYGRT